MKVLGTLLFVIALGYACYAGFVAISDYIVVAKAIDEALQSRPTSRWDDPTDSIRTAVLHAARDAGIPLEDRDVVISDREQVLKVLISWAHPVLVVGGSPVVSVPVWLERSVASTSDTGAARPTRRR